MSRAVTRVVVTLAASVASFVLPASPAIANPYGPPGLLSDAQSGGGGLGQSVSIAGDGSVAVIGEPGYNGGAGAALVYAKANGTWSLVQRLTPAGETGAGQFGAAVSLDSGGQALLVGAPQDDGGVGAAWVFSLSNGTWTQQAELLGGAGETGAGQFGASVGLTSAGMLALVGAPMSDAGEGQVFTYHYYDGYGWELWQHMDRLGVSGTAHFGASVAIASNGTDALVGAPNAANGSGAVYLYTYFGLESLYWIDGPVVASPSPTANFGASVTMSQVGDLDIVGAPMANSGAGAAYEYRRSGDQLAVFSDPSGSGTGQFGASVSLAGSTVDQLVAGAPGENAAYDFDSRNGANWLTDGAAISPSSAPAPGDGYGTAVAVSADATVALVGAPGASAGDGAAAYFAAPRITAPDSPGFVQAVAGAESVSVSWSVPDTTGGSPITDYTVTASPGGQTCVTTSALACTVGGLTDGQIYTFTVTATNDYGTSAASAPSNPATPQAAGAGGGGGGTGGGGDGSGGGVTGGGTGASGGSSAGGSAAGGGAASAGGSAGATAASGGAPPTPPGALKLTRRTRTSITFSWRAPTGTGRVAGYRVYEFLRGKWRLVGRTSATKRWFVRRGLRHHTRHRFAVATVDAAGHTSALVARAWFVTS